MTLQLQIEKLKGAGNYKLWSMTVRAFLEMENLWNVVEQGPEHNAESLQKDKRAKFVILGLIEGNVCNNDVGNVMGKLGTAREVWAYLRKTNGFL